MLGRIIVIDLIYGIVIVIITLEFAAESKLTAFSQRSDGTVRSDLAVTVCYGRCKNDFPDVVVSESQSGFKFLKIPVDGVLLELKLIYRTVDQDLSVTVFSVERTAAFPSPV